MVEVTIQQEATDNGLATILSDLLRQNLHQNPGKIKTFNSLKAKVFIEALDLRVAVGLEFKCGSLIISGNLMGQPDLHIITDSTTLLDLCLLKIKFGLPYFFDGAGFKIFKKLLTGKLLIRGMFRHSFTLLKLTRLFSVV